MKLINLNAIPEELLPIVGGKARGLYMLNKYGFAVPAGFIIVGYKGDATEAIKLYNEMNLGKVAVRSSATSEDGVDFSFAGQYDTLLNIEGAQALAKAIDTCQESLQNDTARKYIKTFLRDSRPHMTIVVQQMVDAKVAGVAFTQAPLKKESVLIEAVSGLGEALVSGEASAQQFLVKQGEYEEPIEALLTAEQVNTFETQCRKAEKDFKMPMDMEWAIDQSGKLQWLQARPITTSEEVNINELDKLGEAEGCVITTSNISEAMPGAVTPLTLSTSMWGLDYGVREIMREIGCVKSFDELPPYSVITPFYNHMFFNMNGMYIFCHTCYGSYKSTLDWAICGKVLEGYPDIDMKDAPPLRKARNTFRLMGKTFNCKPALRMADEIGKKVRFNLTFGYRDLYKQITDTIPMLNKVHYCHYWASFSSGAPSNIIIITLRDKYENFDALMSALAGILIQIDNVESVEATAAMRRLVRTAIKHCPEVVEYDDENLVSFFKNSRGEVKEAYDEFMERHGHRGIRELELNSLPWKQDTKTFVQHIRSLFLTKGEEPAAPAKSWKQYANEILAKTPTLSKPLIKSQIKKARQGVRNREFTKSRMVYVTAKFKEAYRQLGYLLRREGLLPEKDLIYFLTHEEIGELINGKISLTKKAIARRRLFPQQMALQFPEACLGKPQPKESVHIDPNATVYAGTPASRGIVEGIARVIHKVEDANKLQPGEIMVTTSTDVGWSPYYNLIGGLISEKGSTLSHGIVIAREYALPCVVNIENITKVVHTGDRIRVDGDNGKITLL